MFVAVLVKIAIFTVLPKRTTQVIVVIVGHAFRRDGFLSGRRAAIPDRTTDMNSGYGGYLD